jgi:N-acetyl-alpha-D-glucosaminyl L-malate synthase BshA
MVEDRPLRIGISCFATHGGSGVVAAELARELARAGHKVHIISFSIPFRLTAGEFFDNIYYHEVSSIQYDVLPQPLIGMELATKIIQIAQDEKLDVLHAHYAIPHAISALMAQQVLSTIHHTLPVVATLHGTDITLVGKAPSFFPLTKWAIEHSNAVTTVSDWLRQETVKTFVVRKPIQVVHNFVDTHRFSICEKSPQCTALREHLARPGEKVVLHVSNFRPVKRIMDVLDTFAGISAEIPARLVLIGDGPERERALDHARQIGIMGRTYFLGKQAAIENYFAVADLLLFPSEYESFGVTALEAMSAGTPVVSTKGSGLSEVVVDGVTGFTCPVGDVPAFTRASHEILKNPDLAKRMGKAGRERAEALFTPCKVVCEYLSIYRRVMEEGITDWSV